MELSSRTTRRGIGNRQRKTATTSSTCVQKPQPTSTAIPTRQPLTYDPLLRFFDYGKHRKGYWDGDHAVVQMEDCIDYVTAACPDDDNPLECKYNLVFEVDHSQAHAKQLPNGLYPKNFNHGFGGKKPVVRPTKIKEADGYLGTFDHPGKLKPGDVELHYFLPTDPPPRCNPTAPPYDVAQPGKTETTPVLLADLQKQLRDRGLNSDGRLPDVQARCKAADPPIPTTVTVPKVKEGWVGKPIGLVELLWRRGFIDPTSRRNPPMKTCLEMAAKLKDFKSELPWMCHVMAKLGARVVFTPKAHCELAGRGVEYIFGCSKVFFRQANAKLDNDKRVNQLEANIRASLNKITLATVRKCSRRAREYKLAYLELEVMMRPSAVGL